MADTEELEEKDAGDFGEEGVRSGFEVRCNKEPGRSHCVVRRREVK